MSYVPRIELIIGKMNRYEVARRKTLVIKWDKDYRGHEKKDFLMTHSKVKISCIRVGNKLNDCVDRILELDPDVIGIDDGQFFEDIIKFTEMMVNKYQKVVIVSALDADFRRKPFGQICDLVAKAETVQKLNSICTSCGKNAAFSSKIVESKSVIDVGGTNKYTAHCRQCYFMSKIKSEE